MKRPKWLFYRDAKREWRWSFVAANGRILADSAESYKRIRDARRAINVITPFAEQVIEAK